MKDLSLSFKNLHIVMALMVYYLFIGDSLAFYFSISLKFKISHQFNRNKNALGDFNFDPLDAEVSDTLISF